MSITFKEYLKSRRITDTLAGDFTKDGRNDRWMPDDFASWQDLKRYVRGRAADGILENCLKGAYQVWLGFERKKAKMGIFKRRLAYQRHATYA